MEEEIINPYTGLTEEETKKERQEKKKLQKKNKKSTKKKMEDLNWKKVDIPNSMELEGFIGLEVAYEEGAEEVVEEEPTKKKKKKNKKKKQQQEQKQPQKQNKSQQQKQSNQTQKNSKSLHSSWEVFGLPDAVNSALSKLGFEHPTPVQVESIQAGYIAKRDILAAAETGSGKTLAFGLPIIAQLLTAGEVKGLQALIMTPTRELAIQVREHLMSISCGINIASIVGGLSVQKQERILSKQPNIVVATPGRLWELLSSGNEFFKQSRKLKYLVIDEADRMVEKGHFRELKSILEFISRPPQEEGENVKENEDGKLYIPERQNFIFSATLFVKEEKLNNKRKKNRRGKTQCN
eukprot:m.139617 g.139617  ORF g.139617 m.139617 type:complete len:351 (+) comp14802_c0_seq1:78-1130(+)